MAKYHMNKKEREITDVEELDEIIRRGKYITIAMCRNDEPYIVTLSYGYKKEETTLYFHSAKRGLKMDFLRENSKVCGTIIEDKGYQEGQCEHHYSSVVLWGKMTIVEELEEKKLAMDVLLNHLEANPHPIKERNLMNEKIYENIGILKLNIEEIYGKHGK